MPLASRSTPPPFVVTVGGSSNESFHQGSDGSLAAVATAKDLVFDASPGANTDILGESVTADDPPQMFRIQVSLSSAAILNRQVTRDGTTKTIQFNSGATLGATQGFQFDHAVRDGDSVNYHVESAVTVDYLSVVQIPFTEA